MKVINKGDILQAIKNRSIEFKEAFEAMVKAGFNFESGTFD